MVVRTFSVVKILQYTICFQRSHRFRGKIDRVSLNDLMFKQLLRFDQGQLRHVLREIEPPEFKKYS